MNQVAAPIEFVDHDEGWEQEFQQMRSCLRDSAQGRLIRIEHIGATAIPGQPARPVVDMLAVVAEDLSLDEVEWCVEGLNFVRLEPDEPARSFLRPRFGTPTHRLFLVGCDDPFAERALAFRDWLLRNPTDAERYAELRRFAAPLFADDEPAYEQAKLGFFGHVLRLHDEAAALVVD